MFRVFYLVTVGYCPTRKDIERISRCSSSSSQSSPSLVEKDPPLNKSLFEFKHSLSRKSSTLIVIRMERRKVTSRSSTRRVSHQQRNPSQRIQYTILERGYSTWTVALLRTFLQHYGRPQLHGKSKTYLMQIMTQVARDYNLEDSDYDDMYAAYWGRQDLPARKPFAAALRPAAVAGHTQQASLASLPGDVVSPLSDRNLTILPTRTEEPKTVCTICWDDLNSDNAPSHAITSKCTHKANVCRSCASQSITSQLDSKIWDQLSCPACDVQMQFADVQRLASATVFARYSYW